MFAELFVIMSLQKYIVYSENRNQKTEIRKQKSENIYFLLPSAKTEGNKVCNLQPVILLTTISYPFCSGLPIFLYIHALYYPSKN